ncbi:MAG: AAA family ATPase [Pyrinomonadaceae bacterium]|nr:AAA family ATPase [Pyrinomonadaceae bacterium]
MKAVMTEKIPRLTLLSDLVGELVADTEAAQKALESGKPRGPVTSLPRLDEALGGYLATGLHILQAAPGAGKSAFSLQIAAMCRFPSLYITTEMGILELFRRLIARETETYLGKLKSGEIGAKEAMRLALATVERLPCMALLDGTNAYASPRQILDVAQALKERAKAGQVLVVIDSVQMWAKSVRGVDADFVGASEYELINAGISALSALATDLNCPVLAISHRNRVGNKNGTASLHSAKGSGEVEYMAESVIDLTRKEEQPNQNGEVEVVLNLLKNRHGVPGIAIPLKFSGRIQRFQEAW